LHNKELQFEQRQVEIANRVSDLEWIL